MLASIARRNLGRAAVDRALLFRLADGENKERGGAEQKLERAGEGQMARFRCTSPDAEGIADALLSDWEYRFSDLFGTVQCAVAVTWIAADLI